jgi:hypothetical protein
MTLHRFAFAAFALVGALVGAVLLAIASSACSTSTSQNEVSSAGPPSLAVAKPLEGQSFEITPTDVDVDVSVVVTNFTLVPLGQEGTDMDKGQVRIFVDGDDCDDPGDPGEGDPQVPYNRILPNAHGESTVGLDYCVGGVSAIDGRSHVLRAELWHGDQPLSISQQLTFRTTFRRDDGGADASP